MHSDDWRKVSGEKSSLQISLEEKWQAQNELEIAKAKHQLEVLSAVDLEQEKRMRHSKMVKATEVNLVAVEKAHSSLKQSGNVPGFVPGSAETVVSGAPTLTTGSISPDSSVSAAEVREMAKKLADSEAENARLKEINREYGIEKLKTGVTVAFTAANMSEAFEKRLDESVERGVEGYEEPWDPDTVYYKQKEHLGMFYAAENCGRW